MPSKLNDPAASIVRVTGIGGFLGGHLAKQLLARGYRVGGGVRSLGVCDRIRRQLCPDTATEAISFVEADLCSDAGWDVALGGCRYVIHTASPFPTTLPKDANAMIRTARDGTVRVLRAAYEAGVMRAVLMVRAMAPFSARSRMIVHELNHDLSVSAAKAQRVLNWKARPDEGCIRATAQSLIEHGLIAAA
jgi:nucleoside-diphosphate-sugar epimerase